MRIAIIGGGAAGMAAAWYLGERHQVTVFEREAMLGGNIRTLGRNVPCAGLPAGLTLEAGVVEFSRENFPLFHALMDELDVELHDVAGTTALYVDGRPPLASPGNRAAAGRGWGARLAAWWRLRPVAGGYSRFFTRTREVPMAELYDRPLDAYLDEGPFAEWARLLMLYAYSIPQEHLDRLRIHVKSINQRVEELSGGQRQAVAIARATAFDAKVVIMDEPTAALAIREVTKVLDLIRSLRDHGVSVILISHRMDDIFYVCDRVMALFHGRNFAEAPLAETDRNEVIGWIMGTRQDGVPVDAEEAMDLN